MSDEQQADRGERHTHTVARDEDGRLVGDIDLCECGRDIRDPIHLRVGQRPDPEGGPDE